eukprot:gene14253-4530_t
MAARAGAVWLFCDGPSLHCRALEAFTFAQNILDPILEPYSLGIDHMLTQNPSLKVNRDVINLATDCAIHGINSSRSELRKFQNIMLSPIPGASLSARSTGA